MRHNGKIAALAGLFLMSLAGAADAGERQSRSPHHQTRGMIERLHNRGDHPERGHEGSRSGHGHNSPHGRNAQHHDHHHRHGHDARHDDHHRNHRHDREPHWGHERWRAGTDGRRHSVHGRGYWHDYHKGHPHHRHYHHRFYNNYHYYYNASGFYFPEYGFISRGHVHGRLCPQWHFEDFATGFVLGAIIMDE